MGPQCSSTDQAGITPGKRLLQSATVTLSPQLGGTPVRRSQAAIDADGQHQPYEGAFRGGTLLYQAVNQTAATASRAAGDISSCGASA